MNNRRLEIQVILETILKNRNVYFQPPASLQMSYPCFMYMRNKFAVKKANDKNYNVHPGYTLYHIYKSPNEDKSTELYKAFTKISHSTNYISDGLYHDVYIIY